jgi:hypothetical protein
MLANATFRLFPCGMFAAWFASFAVHHNETATSNARLFGIEGPCSANVEVRVRHVRIVEE